MTATGGAGRWNMGGLAQPSVPPLRWWRVFPGQERELSALRGWLSSLLPLCPARDDLLSVATELASNAIRHTTSGSGGWFAVEVTWHESVVQVAVADGGGPAEPRVIEDPAGESGRGLLLVQGLSVRTGVAGDRRGRLVWAEIAWPGLSPAVHPPSQDPYQAAVREAEGVLARRFAGVPVWFGRSTLAWWAMAGPEGLVSAPTAQELAGLLDRLLEAPDRALSWASGQAQRDAGEQPASRAEWHPGAASWDETASRRPRAVGVGMRRPGSPGGQGSGRRSLVHGLAAVTAMAPAVA